MRARFEESSRREAIGFALGFVGMVIFAMTVPMTRLAVAYIDPLTLTVLRGVIGGLAALAYLVVRRRPIPWRHFWLVAAIAVCVLPGFPGLLALAMQTVPASHGGIVLGIMPLATAVCAALVAGERPSPTFYAWAAAGTLLVCAFSLRDGGWRFAVGDLYLVGTIVMGALGYALSGRLAREMDGLEVVSWALVLCLPVSLLLAAFLLPSLPAGIPASAWGAVAFVGLMSQFIGFLFWNTGLAIGGIARIGQIQLLQTFVILAASALLLGERIDLVTVLAAVAVAAVVWMGRKAPVGRAEPARPFVSEGSR